VALVLADRVKETSTTTGTGTYTLAGAVTGFESFGSIGNGNTTYYACTLGSDFEVGIGTYTASGTTLARTTILQSSNSDNAVNWGSGTKTLFCTQPAEKAVFLDASGNIIAANGSNLTNLPAGNLTGTVANARLDQQLQDVAGLAVTNGNFIVGDGSNFVAESGSTARTSLGLGTISTQAADSVNIDGGAIDGVTLGTNSAITEAQIDDFNFNNNSVNVSDTLTGFIIKVNDEFVARFQSSNLTVGGGGLYLYQNNPFITFEGATADSHETNLKVTDPTADRDITLPDATGTVLTTGNSDTPSTTTSSSDADFVLIDDGGTMKKITPANLGVPANKDFGLVTGSVTGTEDFGSVA